MASAGESSAGVAAVTAPDKDDSDDDSARTGQNRPVGQQPVESVEADGSERSSVESGSSGYFEWSVPAVHVGSEAHGDSPVNPI